jgi:hypothetical protein
MSVGTAPCVASGSDATVKASARMILARLGISREEKTGAVRNAPETRASTSTNA